jgi:PKD repeat protein
MKYSKLLFAAILIFNLLLGQQKNSVSHFITPKMSKSGIIATDVLRSKLYLINEKETKTLFTGRGIGYNFSLSPDKDQAGIKIIDDFGMENPALLSIKTGKLTQLHEPVENAGQVSFSDNGLIGFTIGKDFHISDGRTYDLGYYCNLAPISPDAQFVAFNDNNDQIIILNLDSNKKFEITESGYGYYNPQWSPDNKQLMILRFDGQICIYNLEGKTLNKIGLGHSPTWQDNETILFYRKEIENQQLINTDIYKINADASNLEKLTNTKDILEIDPHFDPISKSLIFNTVNSNTIQSVQIDKTLNKKSNHLFHKLKQLLPFYPKKIKKNSKLQSFLDIPYIHQVYDVPDWYWGHYACGPTSSAMVLAYYKILPKWETTCSQKGTHKSYWGRYICEKYRYKQWYYDDGSSPNGNATGYGGYGYMWGTGGSPNSRMLKYHQKHGLTGSQDWNTQGKWQDAVDEIASGYPYTLCVWLTGGGHIIVGKGIVENKHSIVVNDPYGNKNTPGYPSYDGKGAVYDWPGYNHGNINLALRGTGLPWIVASHYSVPAAPDTLVDDFHLAQGFYLNAAEPASMIGYYDKTDGYNDHFWYMNSRSDSTIHYAEWTPNLPNDGNYEILVFIPELEGKCQTANYKIFAGVKEEDISINQSLYSNEWVSIGVFPLESGSNSKIVLTDSTNTDSEKITIDAIKWNSIGEWNLNFATNNNSGDAPFTVLFSEDIEYTPEHSIFLWDFGDGSFSDEKNPIHVYKNPGIYNVKLTFFIGSKEYIIYKENLINVSESIAGDFSLISPEKNFVFTSQYPELSWQKPESEIINYNIYLNTTSDFTDIQSIGTDTTYYKFPTELDDNCEFFWQVKAITSSEDTLISNISYFQINLENENPSEFAIIFPKNNAILHSETCTFQWEKSHDNDVYDQINYDLNLWKNEDDSTIVYTGLKTFFKDTLEDNCIYHWNVLAKDNLNGITQNSENIHEFTVNKVNDPPTVVELLKPVNNSTISDKYPEFIWTPSIDIDPLDSASYVLYIFRHDKPSTGVFRASDTCYYNKQKISSETRYGWTVKSVDQNDAASQSDTFYFDFNTTAIDEYSLIPTQFQLYQNYPNPFNPETTIEFDLPIDTKVNISIFDINGRKVEQIISANYPVGNHKINWIPDNISSGIYFYKIYSTGQFSTYTKIIKCMYLK